MDTVIKGGTIVTATETLRGDVGIANGHIAIIGLDLPIAGALVVGAVGKLVMPGGVDPHTHLDSRSQGTVTADDWESGTIAAACGGTTTIVDFCFPARGESLGDGLAEWHRRARDKAVVDYGFHAGILEERDAIHEEIPTLPKHGVATLKIFMAYKHGNMVSDWTLYRTLRQARGQGALVLVHAENGDAIALREQELIAAGKTAPKYHAVARPPRVEAEATGRAIALAELASAPVYVVHVSCSDALEEIARGRARGVRVFAETCPHYLFCTVDDLDQNGFAGAKFVCSPALREPWQHDVLWNGLQQGVIQVIGSDHSAFNYRGVDQKERGLHDFTRIPNGVPGIEERLMLAYQGVVTGKLSLNRFVDAVATAPARIMGLGSRKGTIAPGVDADLVVWDPNGELTLGSATLHHRVDYSLYEGMRVRGIPDTVLSRGDVIVRGRQPVGRPGRGQYLPRTAAGGT